MKNRTSFVCQQCGNETASWLGRCPSCGEWNSLVETARITGRLVSSGSGQKDKSGGLKPLKLSEIKHLEKQRMPTGFEEFNRVLGGGIVPGGVVLIAGDPGVGKSTLLLAMAGKTGGWYVTGEESAEQVKMRAERLKVVNKGLYILPETNIESILNAIETAKELPKLVIIDSIQTMTSDVLEGLAGTAGQIRQATQLLIQMAKNKQVPVFIIGHVTKEGAIAGPKLLEHMVDVVCYFEGDRYYQGRILRTLKNRFGPTDEVGIFEMAEIGLVEISNPSKLFLEERKQNVPGSAIGVTLEGTRPLLIEIQALIVPTQLAMPRRVASGIDYNRLQVILAIIQKKLNLPLGNFDVFVSISGGLKIHEPAIDLPVALAVISAFKNIALPNKTASFGELGLLGEIRRVQGEDKRKKEARRLGYEKIISTSSVTELKTAAARIG